MMSLQLLKTSKSDIAAAFAGLLSALPFIWPYSAWMAALAWISLVPLVLASIDRPWRRGLIAGVCFFAPVLYWLNHVMIDYGGLHPLASLGLYLLLVIYLAMFWGASCWCSMRIINRCALPLSLVFPLVWIGFEFLRSKLLTGFPWGSIVYSQAALPLLVQSVDTGGIWVPMLVLLLMNCAIAGILRGLWCGPAARDLNWNKIPWMPVGAALILFVLNATYGYYAQQHEHQISINDAATSGVDGETQALDVVLIQANIDQHQKWLRSHRAPTLNLYTDMSRKYPAADLIVWPESATPFYYALEPRYANKVKELARELQVHLLFGSPAREQMPQGYTYLNSAYLLDPKGETVERTDKVHLVPFGEYVPLSSVLGFVDKMAVGVGDFRPGNLKLLPLSRGKAGVLICYEAIFPHLARTQVAMGAGILFNLTNDAWFGDTPAPHQHLQMARFRALENRRWLARSANTGVSALIDPYGTVHDPTHIFEAGVVTGRMSFRENLTLYTRYGDVLAWTALAVLVGWMWQSRKKSLSARG
ncbi:MAG: apolipoprotein N-acyltransferase [Desulfuromonadaceae bacterium]